MRLRIIQNDVETNFKMTLRRRFNLRELRAVGIKFGNATARMSKSLLINLLYQYFNTRIMNPNVPHVSQVSQLSSPALPTTADPIPAYASDLELYEETLQLLEEIQEPSTASETEQLNWYIDRTPTPWSLIRYQTFLGGQRLHTRFSEQLVSIHERIYSAMILDSMRRDLTADFNDAVGTLNAGRPQVKKYNINIENLCDGVEEEEACALCAICFENKQSSELIKLNCNHDFCGECIKGTLVAHDNIYKGPSCALCRVNMLTLTVRSEETLNLVAEHCNTL